MSQQSVQSFAAYRIRTGKAPDPEVTFEEIAEFRAFLLDAWKTRGILLVQEEQERLKDEIRDLHEFLQDLTQSA